MRFRRGARLDSSQVRDRRGFGSLAAGGGGLIGLVVLAISLLSGGDPFEGATFDLGAPGADLSTECRTGEDANQKDDCRIVGVVNSVQVFWSEKLESYKEADTVFFSGSTSTGCGGATSAVGPFYCPLDQTIYIDLGFYEQLRQRFGARGGPFAEAYVIAHEYGHHVENLLGRLQTSRQETGPQSDAVRIELMADCLAGMWARGAVDTGFIEEITADDIRDGLDAAASIGDDRIQEKVQGRVEPESWTHGSSAQRQEAFSRGYGTSRLTDCDPFD